MEEPCMILRGTRHMMKIVPLHDVIWLLICVDEFDMMQLKTQKTWLCACADEFMWQP
jgi:hypothetical protein